MSDPEIVELCQAVYSRHRRAIDLIMEYGAMTEGSNAAARVLSSKWTRENLAVARVNPRARSTWFIPAEWEVSLKNLGGPGFNENIPYGLACYFWTPANEDRVGFVIEVGPLDEHANRVNLLTALRAEGFRVPDKSFDEAAKFTRIYSDRRRLAGENQEEKVLTALWKKANAHVRRVTKVLNTL